MTLPDNIVAAFLLRSANLLPDKAAMCRATCSTLTYDNMRLQIEKVGAVPEASIRSQPKADPDFDISKVKIEQTYLGHCHKNNAETEYDYTSCSDDSQSCYSYGGGHPDTKVLYGGQRRPSNRNYRNKKFTGSQSQGKMRYCDGVKYNPLDEFGNISTCGFCKSICHWLADCPVAPDHIKNSNKKYYKKKYRQPL